MKGISTLMPTKSSQRTLNEAVGTSGSWFKNERTHTNEIADEILDDNSETPMPDIVVTDNPKAMKYVNALISQLNKKCGWKCYYNDMFVNIDGRKSVIITDEKSFGTLGFAPTNDEKGSTFYYFKEYDEEGKANKADLVLDCGELGIVQALSTVINYINNPLAYSKSLKEAKETFDTDEEAIDDYYHREVKAAVEKDTKRFLRGFGGSQVKNATPEGIEKLTQWFKDNPKVEPWQVYKEIINDTVKGDEIRVMVGDSEFTEWKEKGYYINSEGRQITRRPKGMGPDRWITILKDVYAEAGGGLSLNEEVETGSVATKDGEAMTYVAPDGTEFDISFITRCHMPPAKFKKLYSRYESLLEQLEIDIRDCVAYAKSNRQDKLENSEGLPNAIFVSGIGGIGKSDTWERVKADMHLKIGIDFEERGNSTVSSNAIYQWVYENNGMFLVFDDTPDLFNTPFTISLWKQALSDIKKKRYFPKITAPSDTQAKYYDLKDCMVGGVVSSKKRYLLECPEELTPYQQKKLTPEELEKYRKESETVNLPNTFDVECKFLFITNLSEESLASSMKESWGAIKSRSVFYKIAPPPAVLWAKIKKTILNTQDDEERCWIPKRYVNEVIDYVESILSKAETLSFRPFASKRIKRLLLQGRPWKTELTTQISNVSFDNDND